MFYQVLYDTHKLSVCGFFICILLSVTFVQYFNGRNKDLYHNYY